MEMDALTDVMEMDAPTDVTIASRMSSGWNML